MDDLYREYILEHYKRPHHFGELVGPNMGAIVITHYQRILNYIEPDFVHVFVNGRIVKEGGPDLVGELEEKGYGWIAEEVAAA